MANTLTGLIPTIYESLDVVSREFVGFIPAMQRDNGNFARAAKGQVVAVPVVPAVTAADITPGVTAPNDGDQVLGSVNLGITKSRYVPIRWNGEEQLGLNNGGPGVAPILVNQLAQGFRTLVNEVESDSASSAVKYASRATGVAGTTPFGTNGSLIDIANTARILDENGAPMVDRHMVMNSPTMANIRGVQGALYKVNEAGDGGDMLRRGSIGALEGFALHYSPGIKQVVKGTGTSFVTGAAYGAGTTMIAVGTGTGTINAGDIITFAGDTNQYAVVSGTNGPGTIQIGVPGLRVAAASGTAVTVGGSYTPNVAFTRDALVLATRLPAVPEFAGVQGDMADDRQTVVDPFSGIAFEVALYRQYRQIKIEIGLAWGVGAIKSDHIAILEA